MPGQAGDRRGCAGAVFDEKGSDEMRSGDGSLCEKTADAGCPAKATASDGDGKS